jgi:hypothetical protein
MFGGAEASTFVGAPARASIHRTVIRSRPGQLGGLDVRHLDANRSAGAASANSRLDCTKALPDRMRIARQHRLDAVTGNLS